MDDNGRFLEEINSGLNSCLTLEANVDQTSRAFIQDVVMSMFDEGSVAIVPVDTDRDPKIGSFDIYSLRTAKILEWYPRYVKVRVYNDRTGEQEDLVLAKSEIAIIENPLYAVINEPNSTMQRLIRKLALLDRVDEESSSGKLDLIIQLPYVIKTQARRDQAERRRKEIEDQLQGSRYGIAYTDGTEKIVQLNRSLDNNLTKQIEYLTDLLYSQLGITQEILNGSANEATMLNYYDRTVEPIAAAIADELRRKFLTKTARTQKQSVVFFRDPFKLVPVSQLAEIADKFTRNEIMTSNEIRQIVGMKPSNDPSADELRNKNLSQPADERERTEKLIKTMDERSSESRKEETNQNGEVKSKWRSLISLVGLPETISSVLMVEPSVAMHLKIAMVRRFRLYGTTITMIQIIFWVMPFSRIVLKVFTHTVSLMTPNPVRSRSFS